MAVVKGIRRNIIKMRKIRRGGFFPLRSAVRNISHREAIYRILRIYRAEGISRAEGTPKQRSERYNNEFVLSKKPLPLAEGVGEGSQHGVV